MKSVHTTNGMKNIWNWKWRSGKWSKIGVAVECRIEQYFKRHEWFIRIDWHFGVDIDSSIYSRLIVSIKNLIESAASPHLGSSITNGKKATHSVCMHLQPKQINQSETHTPASATTINVNGFDFYTVISLRLENNGFPLNMHLINGVVGLLNHIRWIFMQSIDNHQNANSHQKIHIRYTIPMNECKSIHKVILISTESIFRFMKHKTK